METGQILKKPAMKKNNQNMYENGINVALFSSDQKNKTKNSL